MMGHQKPIWGVLGGALGIGTLWALLASGGCVAIADIGDIEFGPATGGAGGTSTSSGTGGTGGTGGTSTSSGTGGDGGSGGAPHSCDDNEQNGQETGIDCGGPDCPECAEDCTNGEDDDGDDLIDCEDSLCAGYQCVPEAPGNWNGPAAFYLGPSGNSVPACDVAWPTATDGDGGTMTAPPASCGACGCDPPTGATCGMPDFWIWEDPACPGTATASLPLTAANTCDSFGGNSNDSVMAGVIPVLGGSCSATSGTPTIDPPSFSDAARVCNGATLGGGCTTSGNVCVRSPQSPYQTSLCVFRTGDVACPGQDYSVKHLVVVGVTDTRGCSACTCASPTGATCSGTTTVWDNQSCSQNPVPVPNDGTTCVAQAGARSVILTNLTGPTVGSCAASGGQSQGTAAVDSSLTVCCMS